MSNTNQSQVAALLLQAVRLLDPSLLDPSLLGQPVQPVQVPQVALPVPTVAPAQVPQVRISTGGNVVMTQAKRETPGPCYGCGKPGMETNAFCAKCRKGAEKAAKGEALPTPGVTPAPTQPVIDLSAFDTPAKASNKGRRDAKAHCQADKCGLFVKAGQTLCSQHQGQTIPANLVTTLEDPDGGFYAVPAAFVEACKANGLRKKALIVKAAKATQQGYAVQA